MKNIIILLLAGIFLTACGNPVLDLEEIAYEPKITVEGYVYPGEEISGILLTKNFPLETFIDTAGIVLTPANNNVEGNINGVPLQYDELTRSYFCELVPDYSSTYTLTVSAVIDGQTLSASSTTVTPAPGFDLSINDLGDIVYRSKNPEVEFTPSPGTGFYAFSIRADVAGLDNFIYDNPYFPDLSRKDVEDNINGYIFQYGLMLNVDSYTENKLKYDILGLNTWFYSRYTVIVYAADNNFKDYLLTSKDVQQIDGNFVEPKFHFTGDGIGVFGSAIKDTLTFNLLESE